MSRGPGPLQRKIVDDLASAPAAHLSWDELKKRFPREATQRGLHRAVRGLLDRGLVYEQHFGGRRVLVLRAAADVELWSVAEIARAQLGAVSRARGVIPPPVELAEAELKRRLSNKGVDA